MSDAIVTERLVLRWLGRESARALARGDYSSVTPAAGWPTDATPIVAGRTAVDPGAATWLITYDGEVIGECGTKHAPDSVGATEIGYGLGAPWRARGYGTEAIRALLSWLEAQPGCRRVLAEVHETNTPSRRLLERLGFAVHDLRPPYVWYARDFR
jgi:RimJ/RimL family protein N-acetyltransferase